MRPSRRGDGAGEARLPRPCPASTNSYPSSALRPDNVQRTVPAARRPGSPLAVGQPKTDPGGVTALPLRRRSAHMTFARIKEARVKFDEHLPIDHRLSKVYRVGAGLMGLVLLAFGILGLLNEVGFFSTHGHNVAGLSSNGALSVLSIVVGILLFVGMVIGGNFASSLHMV